jgi:hypothetical protein
MIDYERAKKNSPKLKAALTRAKSVRDPLKRYEAVTKACKKATQEWDAWGAWPDAWSTWQRALDDAHFTAERAGNCFFNLPRLEDL